MTTAIAIFKIRMADPSAAFIHTGVFDTNGDAVVKKSSRVVHSGEFFDIDDADELAYFIKIGAARMPTAEEIALRDLAAKES